MACVLLLAIGSTHGSAEPSLPAALWEGDERVRQVLEATDDFTRPERYERMQGGAGTSRSMDDRNAFSQHTGTLPFDAQDRFKLGNALFNKLWVAAPTSTHASDGLGPFYSARACQSCHIKDGRGHLPGRDRSSQALVLQLRRPFANGWTDDPSYGGQLHAQAVPGVRAEATIAIDYETMPVMLSGDEPASLRKPAYHANDLAYGKLHPDTRLSPRLAPGLTGLGLLEAIDDRGLLAYEDPDDSDGDGISGRANWQTMPDGSQRLGRFGLKAAMSSLEQQNVHAMLTDMGLSSPLLPKADGDCTDHQTVCETLATGVQTRLGETEVPDPITELVTFYTSHLAVPPRRDVDDPDVLAGKALFYDSGCTGCHTPKHVTARTARLAEHRFQLIWPYTDLLLHDMGDALADDAGEAMAGPREWRTPPLWGLGLARTVNPAATYLHDGRADTLLEAVLWHGGEAEASAERVRQMAPAQRDQLIRFLESL